MAFQRSQGVLVFLLFAIAYPFSFMAPSRMLTNFLLPIYGIANLFQEDHTDSGRGWGNLPEIFRPADLSGRLEPRPAMVIGFFVWRVLVRKTANPFQAAAAALGSRRAVHDPHRLAARVAVGSVARKFSNDFGNRSARLRASDAALGRAWRTICIGIFLLAFASPLPEHVRVEALAARL